jgi:hypothetical protein
MKFGMIILFFPTIGDGQTYSLISGQGGKSLARQPQAITGRM